MASTRHTPQLSAPSASSPGSPGPCSTDAESRFYASYQDGGQFAPSSRQLAYLSYLARFQGNTASSEGESTGRHEHRSGFMPVLMQTLQAKMMQRFGMRTGGKAG
ncbi:hypothetical protein QAD02_004546 [Eretmocerus hayati]|uniref:Uncharacterized protein n=1 Tax=Eretmocerus hayati TaxID=131215 RepID=A0ACC2NPU1_9HYME|nr:hypothetical protein QAD02_004546 [Eretmocerus hayati]